jgi:hypothetical protein
MPDERPYVAENAAELERLRGLVARLSDEELARPLDGGWMAATVLAHLAFWDRRNLALLERWRREGVVAPPKVDVHDINYALRTVSEAIPPRAAARLAVAAAEAIDGALAQIAPELAAQIEAVVGERALRRALHRREHLDQIERGLPAVSAP